jgi:hypothetical protein
MSVDDRAAVPHRKKPRLLEPSRLVCCLCWSKGDCWQQLRKTPASSADPVVHEIVVIAAGVAECGTDLNGLTAASAWAIEVREADMTRAELDAALARLGLAVPEGERDQIVAAAHLIEDMVARLRPVGGRDVAAEPAHVVRFPEG